MATPNMMRKNIMDDRTAEPVPSQQQQQDPAPLSSAPEVAPNLTLPARVLQQLRTNVAYLLLTIGAFAALALVQWLLYWVHFDRDTKFLRIGIPLLALLCFGAGLVLAVRTLARAGGCLRPASGMGPWITLKVVGAALMGLAVIAMAMFVTFFTMGASHAGVRSAG